MAFQLLMLLELMLNYLQGNLPRRQPGLFISVAVRVDLNSFTRHVFHYLVRDLPVEF
jgi:hypothetical protein